VEQTLKDQYSSGRRVDWARLVPAYRPITEVRSWGRRMAVHSELPEECNEATLAMLAERMRAGNPTPPAFKALPLPETGKVRVATLHTALDTHLGRCLSVETISLLRAHPWFRAGLTDDPVRLKATSSGKRLYSADLSAATDHILFDDAQAVVRGIAAALGWSALRTQAALRLVGPQGELTPFGDYDHTQVGILLGLGVTWTILSIINAHAAWRATRQNWEDRSFAICGDDLIGLWEVDEIVTYGRELQARNLKLNHSKSFLGDGGVFCEKIMYVEGGANDRSGLPSRRADHGRRHTRAHEVRVIGLGELSMTHTRRNRGDVIGARDQLAALASRGSLPSPVRRLIQSTLRLLRPKGFQPGPSMLGGAGGLWSGRVSGRLLQNGLRHGALLRVRGATIPPEIREKLHTSAHHAGVKMSDVLTTIYAAQARATLSDADPRNRANVLPLAKVRALAKLRLRRPPSGSISSAIKQSREVNARGKKLLQHLIRATGYPLSLPLPNTTPKTFAKRWVAILRRHKRDPLILESVATGITQEMGLRPGLRQDETPIPWKWSQTRPTEVSQP